MPASTEKVDPKLKEWCSESQARYIDAVNEHGSMRAAARALKVNYYTVHCAINRAQASAARRGYAPDHDMVRTVPEGFRVKGVSTYYNEDGKPVGQWVKSEADKQAQEALMRSAFEAMAEDLPRLSKTLAPADTLPQLCNVYTLTDSHVGALCWGKETGADWDLKIAEEVLTGCFERMLLSAPRARVGIVAQLGDFLHQDSMAAVTPTNGHLLDADGRFSKVVQVAVRVLRRVVDLALKRHEAVVVLLAEGNHDLSSSIWLRTMFAALYENEPRIKVIDSPLPYYVHQHGETMIGWHHGHLKKNDGLPLMFAAAFAKVWGNTTKRYIHTGHRHHIEEKEHDGVVVVQHPTLAARDAYAARGGWIAERSAKAITYHERFGEVGRVTVTPEMLR
jgi:phosphoribosylformylglycinamidine (FGAM) synthase-like enzyme